MNEIGWNSIGAAAAAALLACVSLMALMPLLKTRFDAFIRCAGRAPVRFASICFVAGALCVYGGTKPVTSGYRVAFVAGAGDAQGEMVPLVCEMGKVYDLPANAFSREGKTFIGWVSSASGKLYDDGMMIFNLTNAPGAVIEFQALWK